MITMRLLHPIAQDQPLIRNDAKINGKTPIRHREQTK